MLSPFYTVDLDHPVARKTFMLIASVFITFLAVNIIYIDFLILKRSSPLSTQVTPAQPSSQTKEQCTDNCVTKLEQKVSQLEAFIATSTPKVESKATPAKTTVTREYYIPFGAGSLHASDWTDVAGLQAYIDTANYPPIKKVLFEVSLHVPTGNETANVRLYNATDNHPVWFSEVFFAGGSASQLLISQPITLDPGNKLYKIQMKTQLQFPAYIDQARVHIFTE